MRPLCLCFATAIPVNCAQNYAHDILINIGHLSEVNACCSDELMIENREGDSPGVYL